MQDRGEELYGIVSFTSRNREPNEIVADLARQSINVTASPRVVTPFDFEARGLTSGIVRASVHYYNTDEEIDHFRNALAAAA